jgi:hypothetical protein
MITKLRYVEFLISAIADYSGTRLAKHRGQVRHDTIIYSLMRGIGVVNLMHSLGKPGQFYPTD